ncbi:GNAT family N-acetyltransferase [Rhizobium sp. SSA_523]|uniref:GNAT family N-acetyltransferase n=1 Tax=Rhizobium sp. SSA_523 TaxID=2952477 RepID=UPI0020904F46|nr:GNAT family N-acetyltransferase [Rhizobium sp. SSA_523]MCO5732897.1 GNAT family N-acetyltransferase [Rhizobium sp. SSA_523]WKC23486.1 GNAT family N-acetyltransferase [Rhizobium sp. SSA_523]
MAQFRKATRDDIAAIVAMLADDALGHAREIVSEPVDKRYIDAFDAIEADKNQFLLVAEDETGEIAGCLQLSFLPGLSHRGMWRGQIESVRIASSQRGKGLGGDMIRFAIDTCRERGCGSVQLTSDKRRNDAHRFYENLGFQESHSGFKLSL